MAKNKIERIDDVIAYLEWYTRTGAAQRAQTGVSRPVTGGQARQTAV